MIAVVSKLFQRASQRPLWIFRAGNLITSRLFTSSLQMEKTVEVYESVASIPTLVEATAGPCDESDSIMVVLANWSQRCFVRGETIKYQQAHNIDRKTLQTQNSLPVTDISSQKYLATSPSGKLRAIFRKLRMKDGEEMQYVEIWTSTAMKKVFDLKELDIHGSVYVDDDFGSVVWSPDETKLLYIAEKKKRKTEAFFKRKLKVAEPADNSADAEKGKEYDFCEDWGEQMSGKHQSVVVILDISTYSFSVLHYIPKGVCPGLCVWTPDSSGIVGVAYKNQPRRLGIVYCTNREAKIFHATLSGGYETLTEHGLCVRSPKFSPDGKTLAWIERSAGGPHHACHRLVKCDWVSKQKSTVVDIVDRSKEIGSTEKFYGIFSSGLLNRCWVSDSRRLVFNTVQMNDASAFIVDTVTGGISKIPSTASCTALDVYEDYVVVAESSPTSPTRLLIGQLPGIDQEQAISFVPVSTTAQPNIFDDLMWESFVLKNPIDHPSPQFSEIEYGALYLGPKEADNKQIPLVVCPHGGPHSASTTQFQSIGAVFAKLGFAVLYVNYHGSAGAGEDSIQSLLGYVGDMDISDVHYATHTVLSRFPALDPEKVVLFGGSHGGLIVCHLSAQHPDFYKAVATRNPVTNLLSMVGITDIPDWVWVECGLEYNGVLFEDALLKKMWDVSPLARIEQVKAPTLLMTGKQDMRVPPSQSYQYYYALKERNVPVRMLSYEDNHPLAKVPVEIDAVINSILWFNEHLQLS